MNNRAIKKEAKKLMDESEFTLGSDGRAIITAKAESAEQIFSQFDFDKSEKLNPELADYLQEKASHVPVRTDLRIKIYTSPSVNETEVKTAIKRNFEREYKDELRNSHSNWRLIAAMSVLGVILMTLLFLCYAFFNNAYITTILEVAVWVVIWEAVDAFVLSRPKIRKQSLTFLKLCTCEIDVVKISEKKTKKSESEGEKNAKKQSI